MGTLTLDNIIVTPLKQISTMGGDVLHAMKSIDSGYNGFGEAYFSWINSGAVKGWKLHHEMILNLIVPVGKVRFVFHDPENLSKARFKVLEIGTENFSRITVPSGFWFGFKGISSSKSLILNISQILHDPNEFEQKPLDEIKFDWDSVL